MTEEIKNDCAGKTAINEQIELIKNQNKADSEIVEKIRQEWIDKLIKDLCCVEFPGYEEKWSWKKLSSTYVKTEKWQKPILKKYWNEFVIKGLTIELPKVDIYVWNRFVKESFFDRTLFQSESITYSLRFTPKGEIFHSDELGKDKKVTYEEVLKQICANIAEYITSAETGYNPRG